MNFRLVREGPERSAAVNADVQRNEDVWRNCRSRFAQAGPFLFDDFCTADAMYAPMSRACEPIASMSQRTAKPIWTLSGHIPR